MRNSLTTLVAALALWGAVGNPPAQAQTLYGNLNQPAVSPYLNVLRGGAAPGVNYYNIVQPQLQLYSAVNQLQSQQQAQTALATNATLGGAVTGHKVQFSNYSHFYPQGVGGLGPTSVSFQGLQNLQMRVQQNLPTRNLGTAPTNLPVRVR